MPKIHKVQFVRREAEAGEVIDMEVTRPDGTIDKYMDVEVVDIGFSPLSDYEKILINGIPKTKGAHFKGISTIEQLRAVSLYERNE